MLIKKVVSQGHTKRLSPVLTEDRVVQDDLLQELNELVGKVGGHEGLDRNRHFLWILRLRQSSLDNLQRETTDAPRLMFKQSYYTTFPKAYKKEVNKDCKKDRILSNN